MFENLSLICDASRVSLSALDRSNGLPNMLIPGDIIKFSTEPTFCTCSLPNGKRVVYISARINDEDTWLPLSTFKRHPDKIEELIKNSKLQKELIEKGKKQLLQFGTAEDRALQILALCKKIINK